LAILLFVFIIFRVPVPDVLAPMIASFPGMIVVIASALSLFAMCNPIVGILGLIVAYELIMRSGGSFSSKSLNLPTVQQSEQKKKQYLNTINSFPVTLEEQTVQNMVPLAGEGPTGNGNYKPVMNPVQGAASL